MDIEQLQTQLCAGSRAALAKAITLVESLRQDHRREAEALLDNIAFKVGSSLRVAISGPPGVGKSTFIEAFGLKMIELQYKVAVLAIDPSSPVTGGSILGDKTRMIKLANHKHAFIRPSPSAGGFGGVARRTREAIQLCEAAGYNLIIVETVGVGQSDLAAAGMTDFFIQLHQPLSGDDLQGIKKGASELADLVLVTKGDGPLKEAAKLAQTQLEHSLHFRLDYGKTPSVSIVSAKTGDGIAEICAKLLEIQKQSASCGNFTAKRTAQIKTWFDDEVHLILKGLLQADPKFKQAYQDRLEQVVSGKASVVATADLLVNEYFKSKT